MAKGNGTTTTIDVASLPSKKRKIAQRFTPQERLRAVEKITAAVKKGQGVEPACAAAGITDASYYVWRKNLGRDKKAVKINGKARPQADPGLVQITLLIQNQPLTVSLEEAIRIQQGLGQLLKFQR